METGAHDVAGLPLLCYISRIFRGFIFEERKMQIPVLIEPVANNGYRARSGEPMPLETEGATREEAMRKLQDLLEGRLQIGVEITNLEIGNNSHPLVKWAGWLKDDPFLEEWQKEMAEYRREIDTQEGIE
jgi:predicted RNase H-like HicB family nuclease